MFETIKGLVGQYAGYASIVVLGGAAIFASPGVRVAMFVAFVLGVMARAARGEKLIPF